MAADKHFDLSSPFISARIITADGVELPLWIDPGGGQFLKNVDKLNIDSKVTAALSFVQDITIEFQVNTVSKITAVLTPPFDAARALLDSDLLVWGAKNFLEVQFGYTGGAPEGPVLSEVFTGMILQPDISLGVDTSITINAQGMAWRSERQSGNLTATGTREALIVTTLQRKYIIAKAQSQAEVVTAAGVSSEFEDFVKSHKKYKELKVIVAPETRDDALSGPLLASVVTEAQGFLTDKAFAEKLAHEANCDIIYKNDTAEIKSRNTAVGGKPDYVLRLFDFPRGTISPGIGTFPILSVSSSSVFQFISKETRGVAWNAMPSEERKKKKDPEVADESTTGQGSNGAKDGEHNAAPAEDGPITPAGPLGRGMAAIVADPSFKKTAIDQAKAQFSAAKANNGVQLEIETYAMPRIEPYAVVQVLGVGKRYDGVYTVLQVTHTLGSAGGATALTLTGTTGFFPKGLKPLKKNEEEADQDDAAEADKITAKAKK